WFESTLGVPSAPKPRTFNNLSGGPRRRNPPPPLFPSLLDSELRPARQRGGLVVQENDAAGLGEGQVGSQRAVVEAELLQDLAVVRVGGIQPGALGGETGAPSQREQTRASLAGAAEPLLELVQAPVEQA